MSAVSCLRMCAFVALSACGPVVAAEPATVPAGKDPLPRIAVTADGKGFVSEPDGKPFKPWGFNYDRDTAGRLLEDYWEAEWPKVVADFAMMKKLGANVVRVHLQTGKFLDAADRPNAAALARFKDLLVLAEREGLYLDVTGLGCYRKADVPAWYDALSEADRWTAQARFWEAIAEVGAGSNAVFCYDLMNEPVVAGGPRKAGDWLGPAFGGKHYVQCITLDAAGRPRPEVAAAWIARLVPAIRKHDRRGLVTVGLVDWSLDRPGLTSGFVPTKISADLDFLCVHLYPQEGKLEEDLKTLAGFAVGKPLIVEETFPLKCSPQTLETFMEKAEPPVVGWISFYWGTPPAELRRSTAFADVLLADWLERMERRAAGTPPK